MTTVMPPPCAREGIQKAYMDEAKLRMWNSFIPKDIIKFVRALTAA